MKFTTGRKVFALFAVTIILFHWRILIGHQFSLLTGYEGANQAYAWFTFLVRGLRTGTSLLWDPYAFAGHPFVDEMQNGTFYPINLLTALFPLNNKDLFSPALYHWLYSLSHIAAAYFMYLLLRELELSVFAGFIGGLGFGLGGIMARTGGWSHLFQGFIWFPLIFLFLLRALRPTSQSASVLNAATAGMGIALALLAGSLYSGIVQAILVVSAVVYAAATKEVPRLRGAIVVGTAGLTALCGSAVQLFPSMAAGAYTLRTLGPLMYPSGDKIPYQYVNSGQWAHSFLGLFLAPTAFGGNLGNGEVASPYIGVLLFLMALIGVWKRWHVRLVRYLTGVTVGAFVFSMGSISIVHGVLYAVIPRLWMAREPTRMLYLADFTVAVLAAFGADALFAQVGENWSHLLTALKWMAIVCGAALAASALFPKLEINTWLEFSLVVMLTAAALLWRTVQGNRNRGMQCLLVGLVLFDLYAFDWDAANVAEYQAKNQDQLDRLISFHGAADFLKKQPGPWRVQLLSDVATNIGDSYGIEATWGAAATVVDDYWRYRSLDVWNARYAIRPATAADPGALYTDKVWKVYENLAANPRAWLVHKIVVESDDEKQEVAIRNPALNLRTTAILSKPLRSPVAGTPDPSERVFLKDYNAAAPVVGVNTSSPAMLVFSEVDLPYWVATVNGVKADIVRVDGVLRGVPVPAGNSKVEMHYRPTPIYIGGVLTVLTFAGLGWMWSAGRRRFF